MLGGKVAVQLTMDGSNIDALPAEAFVHLLVPPGEHTFTAGVGLKAAKATLRAVPGETLLVHLVMPSGSLGKRFELNLSEQPATVFPALRTLALMSATTPPGATQKPSSAASAVARALISTFGPQMRGVSSSPDMKRIATAVVLIAVVLVVVLYGPLWLIASFAALVAGLAAYEYRELAHTRDVYIPLWWLIASTVLIFFFTVRLPDFELPVLTLLTFILLAWSGFRAPLNRVLLDTSLGLFALIYVVYPLTLLPPHQGA